MMAKIHQSASTIVSPIKYENDKKYIQSNRKQGAIANLRPICWDGSGRPCKLVFHCRLSRTMNGLRHRVPVPTTN